jgi:hypothetical protein
MNDYNGPVADHSQKAEKGKYAGIVNVLMSTKVFSNTWPAK